MAQSGAKKLCRTNMTVPQGSSIQFYLKLSQSFYRAHACHGWVTDRNLKVNVRFTVITPPRHNAPDMTPPTTRHKERGIFTTRLKNDAA